MTTQTMQIIMMTLTILATGGVTEEQAKAAVKTATDNKIADIFIDIVVAGVKSGAVTAEAAAKQLADMANNANEKADIKAAAPVATVTNTASEGAIIVSGAGNTINFVAPGTVMAGNGKKAKGGKGSAEGEKKTKMTAEESDKLLESADHGVAVWYPKDVKSGRAIYKIDSQEPVTFNFGEPKDISDTVVGAVKDLEGTIACNNPFVVKALGENKGVFAANSKGSKMLKAVKALGDLMAAGDGASSGSGQAAAPKGAAKPPKSSLGQKAAARAAAQAQTTAGELEVEGEEAAAEAV